MEGAQRLRRGTAKPVRRAGSPKDGFQAALWIAGVMFEAIGRLAGDLDYLRFKMEKLPEA